MTKKLTKHGNSLALIIDKPILDLLKIDQSTELTLSIKNGKLIIETKNESNDENKIDEIADKIIKKYGPVLKKLSE